MRFDIFGNRNKPVIIMLPGSFCPAESMKNLYDKLCSDFYVIAVTYNGHHIGSKDFTSRQGEAAEILQYLNACGIGEIKMIYGQSMGAEIGIELLRQLSDNGISVQKAFFDGAPCIKMTRISKAFMLIKFRSLVQMVRTKPIDAIVKIPLVKEFANGDTEALRPLLIDMKAVSPCLTNKSIRNVNECCYSFDFPRFDLQMQKNIVFLYGEEETAYKLCAKHVRKAYPYALFKTESGQGHLTYVSRQTEAYIQFIKELCL